MNATEIDVELLIQQIRDEQEWQTKEWQREVMEQFGYDRKEKPA